MFRPLSFSKACWLTADDPKILEDFARYKGQNIAFDKDENMVYFAESEWMLRRTMEDNKKIQFHFTSEFKTEKIQ